MHRLIDKIVLLDKADVFLEESSLADMQRNTLVSGKLLGVSTSYFHQFSLLTNISVFACTRVLRRSVIPISRYFVRNSKHTVGILILTSNRVGTFDEAFNSRIQLSLHYENLTCSQRRTI